MSTALWHALDDASLTGEQRLVAALLAQMIHDARQKAHHGSTRWWHRQEARRWLLEGTEVVTLLELVGLDADVYHRVLAAAHLEERRGSEAHLASGVRHPDRAE